MRTSILSLAVLAALLSLLSLAEWSTVPMITASAQTANTQANKEIDDQRNKVNTLNRAAERASSLNHIVLGVAAVVAALLVIFSQYSRRADGRARDAENQLSALVVTKVKADAEADAKTKADTVRVEAERETKRVEGEAAKNIEDARAEAGVKIEQARGEAEVKIAEARRATEDVRQQNLATELRLEEEKTTRLELEKSLAPRTLPLIVPPGRIPIELAGRGVTIITSDGESNLDPLKRFKGQTVILRLLSDAEARRAARQVMTALEYSGWKILVVITAEELEHPFWDGVVVEPYHPDTLANLSAKQMSELTKENERLSEVADSVIKLLKDNDWTVKRGSGMGTSDIPPGSIRVNIGFKPPPKTGAATREVETRTGVGRKPSVQPQRTNLRHIEDFQREIISKKLAELPVNRRPVTPIEIRCPAENKEACAFAEEILSILKADNWPISGDKVIRDPDFPRRLSGLIVRDPLNDTWPMASLLYEAFLYGSLTPQLDRQLNSSKSDPVQIMVGW